MTGRLINKKLLQGRCEKISHRKWTLVTGRTFVYQQVTDELTIHIYRPPCEPGGPGEPLRERFKQSLRITYHLVRIGDYQTGFVFEDHAPAVQIADLLDCVLDLVPILVRLERVAYQLLGTPRPCEFDFFGKTFGLDTCRICRVDADAGDREGKDQGEAEGEPSLEACDPAIHRSGIRPRTLFSDAGLQGSQIPVFS